MPRRTRPTAIVMLPPRTVGAPSTVVSELIKGLIEGRLIESRLPECRLIGFSVERLVAELFGQGLLQGEPLQAHLLGEGPHPFLEAAHLGAELHVDRE